MQCHGSITQQFLLDYQKIKSNLRYTCGITPKRVTNGPSYRLSTTTQLRKNVAAVASRWRHCAHLTGPGCELQTSRTDSIVSTTELTGLALKPQSLKRQSNHKQLQTHFNFIMISSVLHSNLIHPPYKKLKRTRTVPSTYYL